MNSNIHLIWLGDDSEGILSSSVKYWENKEPNRKCLIHTSDELLLPEWQSIYNQLTIKQQKSDLLRWSILSRIGGWYFDCDIRLNVTLEEMEKDCTPSEDVCVTTTFGQFPAGIRVDVLNCYPPWGGFVSMKEYVKNAKPTSYSIYGIEMLRTLYLRGPNWFRQAPPKKYSSGNIIFRNFGKPSKKIVRTPIITKKQQKRDFIMSDPTPGVAVEFPSFLTRAKNYLAARKIWVAAGKPLRADEEIKRIFDNLCSKCDYYYKENSACKICGCLLSDKPGWNKIAWSTTRCPLDPPKWEEEEAYRTVDTTNAVEDMTVETIPAEALPVEPQNAKIVEEVTQATPVAEAAPAPAPAKPPKRCGCGR